MNKVEIKDAELLEHLNGLEKDGMSVFVMAEGQFRGAFFNGTMLVNQMRANQNLGILETYVLGQAMLCATLFIPLMKAKEKEHWTFTYQTDGICKGFCVEADSLGYVRGHLLQDRIPLDKPLESWDLKPFFGNGGTMTMSKLTEGMKEPAVSTVEIAFKNIAMDLAYFFDQSEQIHSAFKTGIQFDKQGRVTGAGGMYVQVMPQAGGYSKVSAQTAFSGKEDAAEIREELITKVEMALGALPNPGQWFSEFGNREDIVYGLFREFKPTTVLERDVIFDCPCSAENFAMRIKNLGKAEVDDILANEKFPLEVICQNCGSVYYITKEMLTK